MAMNKTLTGFLVFGVIALSGMNIYQFASIKRLEFMRYCSDERSRINGDQLYENTILLINDLRDQNIQNAKGQGKIEGMIAAINNMKPDDQNEYSAIWHSGYYAGTNTNEQAVTSAYESGYHKATEDGHCTAKNTPSEKENIFPAANKVNNKKEEPKKELTPIVVPTTNPKKEEPKQEQKK
jgi:hypothetical protein